jgi:hypothetical protein
MEKNDLEEICPTCGQPMKHLKSKKQHIHPSEPLDDSDRPSKPFDIFTMYQCLNCDEEWEKEISKNVFRKKHTRVK